MSKKEKESDKYKSLRTESIVCVFGLSQIASIFE